MRRILVALLCIYSIFFLLTPAQAASVDVHFFWGDGCPHCAKEELFLQDLKKDFGDRIAIHSYEVWYNAENRALMSQMARDIGTPVAGVPAIFIGDEVVVGFASNETTGEEIRQLVNAQLQKQAKEDAEAEDENNPLTISVPFVGAVDTANLSIPVLTAVVAAVDGFNPCAMWVLVLLIGMLIGVQDKKRLWILGGCFIAVSGLVYFVFLAAWLNVFQVLGALRWIQIFVGLFAIGAGVYYLWRFWKKKSDQCEVTNPGQKIKIIDRMKDVVNKKSLMLASLGMAALAVMVNGIELACSAGLPAIYTQVLSLAELPAWQYYAYLLLYVFIFMLDDLIVFGVAVTSLRAIGLSGKFSHIASLVGGIIILLLGLLLLIRPELLFFG